MSLFSILKVMLLDNLGTLHSPQWTSFSSLFFPTIDSWTWTDQEAFITSNYIYVWSSWMLMCSGTSLSSSESLVTFSFVEDPRLDEKEIGRGTSQEGFWDSGKMLVDWINRATSIVEVTNNRGENVSSSSSFFTTTKLGHFLREDTTTVGFHLQFMAEKYWGRQAWDPVPTVFLSLTASRHQEDEKLSHVKNVATWPCTSPNLTLLNYWTQDVDPYYEGRRLGSY